MPASWNVAEHFDGNADWATNFSPKCDAKNANVGVNGFVSIALSCTDPDAGFGAAPPTPTPLDDSALEIASPPAHGTLGGLSNGKVIYTPNKDFKGTDSFTYIGSDETSELATGDRDDSGHQPDDQGGGRRKAAAGDTTAPSISGDQGLGQEMAARQTPGEHLQSAASARRSPSGSARPPRRRVSFQRATRKNGKPRYVKRRQPESARRRRPARTRCASRGA